MREGGRLRFVTPGVAKPCLLALLGLVFMAAGAGALLARLAPYLLGPSSAERLVALKHEAARLAQRNRLARELHDSVGHALSIVTVQAAAAGRVLDADPGFARQALSSIESSARAGLRDLDHVLGLLRDGTAPRTPSPSLADLDRLLDQTRAAGIDVRASASGPLDAVPHMSASTDGDQWRLMVRLPLRRLP